MLLSPARRERPRLGPAGPRSRRQTRPSNASAASAVGAREDERARETSYGSNFSDEPESIISGSSSTETTIPVSTPVTAVIPETIVEDPSATTDSESLLAPSIVSSTAHGHSSDSARLSTASTGILYGLYSNTEPDFNHDMQSPPAYSATDFGSRIHTPDPSTTAFSSPSQPVVHLDEDVTIRVPLQPSPNPSQLHTRDLPLSPPPRLPSSSPTPIATVPPVSSSSIPPPFNSRDSFHQSPSPSPLLTTSFPHQQRHSTSSSPRSSSPRASTPSRNSPLPSRPSTSLSVYQHAPPSTASVKSVNSNSNSNSNTPKSAPIPLPPLPPLIPIEFPDPPLNLSAIGDEDYARYKPLTLEAAQWTLSSGELQALVSAAIRESADVRFIRCVFRVFVLWLLRGHLSKARELRGHIVAQTKFIVLPVSLIHRLVRILSVSFTNSSPILLLLQQTSKTLCCHRPPLRTRPSRLRTPHPPSQTPLRRRSQKDVSPVTLRTRLFFFLLFLAPRRRTTRTGRALTLNCVHSTLAFARLPDHVFEQ